MDRRKPKADLKTNEMRIRITDEEKATFQAAAKADARNLSDWLRWLALQRAARVVASTGSGRRPRK